MTFTLPVWLLWVVGIPLGAFILWLVFLGACLFKALLEWHW